MPILNYTTSIDAWKTVNEIQQIMSKHRVSHFSIKNEGTRPVALSFTIDYNGRPLNFLLPCNHAGVWRVIQNDKDIRPAHRNEDQAFRTSWRIIKDWVEAQLAIVEAELAPIEEVFMAYLVLNGTGETLSQKLLKGDGMKLLGNG